MEVLTIRYKSINTINLKIIYILIIILFPIYILSQNLCETGGAQGGALGITDCFPYDSPCAEDFDAEIRLVLITDDQGQEISWIVTDESDGGLIVGEGNNLDNNENYDELLCVMKDHCYRFTIMDSAGNGINPAQGSYELYWNGDEISSGANFGIEEIVEIGACCSDFSFELIGGKSCVSYIDAHVYPEIQGGTPPFDYLWSTGKTFSSTYSLSGIQGEISLTITDASGCVADDAFSILNLEELDIELSTITASYCAIESGRALSNIISGIPPFKYNWSNGETGSSIENVISGNYMVKVTDAGLCESINSIEIDQDEELSIDFNIENVSCHGTEDGSITGVIFGGATPYTYKWSTGVIILEHPTVGPGIYYLTVTDSKGCVKVFDAEITEPDPILITLVDSIHHETGGMQNGKILIDVSGGVGSYFYEWTLNGNLFSTDEDLTGLEAGIYQVTIVDSNGCIVTANFEVISLVNTQIVDFNKKIMIVPNPTNGKVTISIEFDQYRSVDLWLTNDAGETVIHLPGKKIQKDAWELDLSKYAEGIYLLHGWIDEHLYTKQIIFAR